MLPASPATVTGVPARAGGRNSYANYFVGQFAFGDLTLPEMLDSLDLFKRHVMPELRESVAVAAE